MPSKKEWVVDEKGYHAKTVWETAPSDKTSVHLDDPVAANSNAKNDDKYEVKLLKGTWHEGEEGFQFNKKCKVEVKAKFLKETARKKVTIDTYVIYNGEEENLGQQVEACLNDDGIAETDVMLYYGDKYSKALQQNPDAQCQYQFKANHSTAKSELESELLDMPFKKPATEISDSVGLNGKNKQEDIKLVKKRLKELGYPVKDISEKLESEDIKAIKFFQAAIANVENNVKKYKKVWLPDGLISKGGNTEKELFGDSPTIYNAPPKGEVKTIQKNVKEDIKNASSEKIKEYWKKIENIWDTVSPFLPEDSYMTSGYRSPKDQRDILHNWFNNKYKDDIIDEYSKEEWEKYKNMQGKNDSAADPKMCEMIKEATGQLIAVPGRSKHQKGQAIDIGGQADVQQAKALLWCNVEFEDKNIVTKILPERNKCLHFEFN